MYACICMYKKFKFKLTLYMAPLKCSELLISFTFCLWVQILHWFSFNNQNLEKLVTRNSWNASYNKRQVLLSNLPLDSYYRYLRKDISFILRDICTPMCIIVLTDNYSLIGLCLLQCNLRISSYNQACDVI